MCIGRCCDAIRFDKIESATHNCQWIRGSKPIHTVWTLTYILLAGMFKIFGKGEKEEREQYIDGIIENIDDFSVGVR